jgi:hypothetical protein
MAKSPGFWFFTGDWMKDPELRFCSLFARGLLVDLLCILFEAKEQGYASNPDGTPRTDEQIVAAISGGDKNEKLAALKELEKSGALSRDSRGVLFSRRLSRLSDLSAKRKQNGSKGGSKRQAKPKQTAKQNTGVSDSDSVSVSDSFLNTHTHSEDAEWLRFQAAWNSTGRAEPWTHRTPPKGWSELLSSPGWIERAREALALLPSRQYFDHPLPITGFFDFVDRIRAGEFANPKPVKKVRTRQPAGGNL